MTNAEIKIGEYVRTLDGDIFKLKGYYTGENIYSMTDNRGTLYGNPRKVVKNHDFDIIKLIEVRRLCEWRTSNRKKRNKIRQIQVCCR